MSISKIQTNSVANYENSRPVESSSGKAFASVINQEVDKQVACRPCIRVTQPVPVEEPVPAAVEPAVGVTAADSAEVTAAETGDTVTATTVKDTAAEAAAGEKAGGVDQAVSSRSAMYRFTMYIRISGDMGGLQQSLVDEFRQATRSFVGALRSDSGYGLDSLDQYLGKAEEASAAGLASSKSFIDNILAAADNGLKAVTASIASSAWMSGLNLTGSAVNSSALGSGSPMDLVKLRLQEAMLKTSQQVSSSSSAAPMVDYGSGFSLSMLKNRTDLKKVDASGNSSDEIGKVAETTAAPVQLASSNNELTLGMRNSVLDKFLELIDSLSSSLGGGATVVRAGFSFAVGNGFQGSHMEVDNSSSQKRSDGDETETVAEPDAVTA
ncbi:hypothetical protein MASR1M12_11840 [Erysipelotrichia bacterium]